MDEAGRLARQDQSRSALLQTKALTAPVEDLAVALANDARNLRSTGKDLLGPWVLEPSFVTVALLNFTAFNENALLIASSRLRGRGN